MAVKKTLISAIPYEQDGKVVKWDLSMRYEDGDASADPSTYYSSSYQTTEEDAADFTPKAKGEWSKSELEDLCPTTKWDAIFASEYDSVITKPQKEPVPDNQFIIPS